jgi:hypothetical protein
MEVWRIEIGEWKSEIRDQRREQLTLALAAPTWRARAGRFGHQRGTGFPARVRADATPRLPVAVRLCYNGIQTALVMMQTL